MRARAAAADPMEERHLVPATLGAGPVDLGVGPGQGGTDVAGQQLGLGPPGPDLD